MAKLRDCNQWVTCQISARLCFFFDILTPYAIFSKVMQSDELDILSGLSSLLRTVKDTEILSTLPLAERPVYSPTLKEISTDQCQELKHFSDAKQKCDVFCQNVTD